MILQYAVPAVGVAFGLLAIYGAVGNLSFVRLLLQASETSIGELDPNQSDPVIIEGTVRKHGNENSHVNPMTGDETVAYTYEVEREVDSGDDTDQLETVEAQEVRTDFYVDDDSGAAYVDPEDARLTFDAESRMSIERGTSLAQRVDPMRTGTETWAYYITGSQLSPGDTVSLCGTPRGNGTHGEFPIGFSETTDGDLLISDSDVESTLRELGLQSGIFLAIGIGFVLGSIALAFI